MIAVLLLTRSLYCLPRFILEPNHVYNNTLAFSGRGKVYISVNPKTIRRHSCAGFGRVAEEGADSYEG